MIYRTGGYHKNIRRWSPETFYPELESRFSHVEVEVAKKLEEWARSKDMIIWWGKGSRSGSFVPYFEHKGNTYQLFVVWTYGNVELYFQWYKERPPFDDEEKRKELLSKINSIEGIDLPESAISRRPSFPIQILQDDKKYKQFIEIYKWVIKEFRTN